MSRLRTKVMLREVVRSILAEDEAGSVAADLTAGAGAPDFGYGMHFGDEKELYNIFVKPFTDVAHVAAGKGKEVSQKVQTLIHVAFEALATSIVPILSSDYGEIFAKEKERIDKIQSEYAEVYNATWAALGKRDVALLAFFYDPSRYLTSKFIEKSPKAAIKALSVLTGGTIDAELKDMLAQFKHTAAPEKHHEGALREDDDEGGNARQRLAQLLSGKEVKEKLSQSQTMQQMEREGKAIVRDTLTAVYKHAQAVLRAKNLNDLQRVVKKKLPGLDKLSQVPEQERGPAEQQLLAGVKKGMKELYVKELTAQVQDAVKSGVPQDHPFVSDYQRVISRINAL